MTDQQEAKSSQVVTQDQQASLLDTILTKGLRQRDETQTKRGIDLIGDFVREVMRGQIVVDKNLETSINQRIAAIDRAVSSQLNAIMHSEPFQKLEGSWRGLHHLVFESETSTQLKLKVMNVSKKDLLRDLEKATEFDQSALFKKVYEEEFGTFGGAPFGGLIGDYEFGRGPEEIDLLEKVSQV